MCAKSTGSNRTTSSATARFGRDVARPVKPGRAVGRLVGGNLALVAHLVGTPALPDIAERAAALADARARAG